MTTWQMYWLVKLDDIGSMLQFFAFLGGVCQKCWPRNKWLGDGVIVTNDAGGVEK